MTILSFFAGIIFQSLFYIHNRSDLKHLFYCLLGASVAFFPFEYFQGLKIYLLYAHLAFFFFFYISLYAVVFKKNFLKNISEIDLIVYGLLLMYILFLNPNQEGWFIVNLVFASVLTLLGLILAFKKTFLTQGAKLICYILYLIANTILFSLYIFQKNLLLLLDSQQNISLLTLKTGWEYDIFITGTTVFLFVVNFSYIMLLFPIKGGDLTSIKAHGKELVEKFNNTQIHPLYAIIIFIFLIGLFVGNFLYNFIDSATLIYFSLFISSFGLPREILSYVKK